MDSINEGSLSSSFLHPSERKKKKFSRLQGELRRTRSLPASSNPFKRSKQLTIRNDLSLAEDPVEVSETQAGYQHEQFATPKSSGFQPKQTTSKDGDIASSTANITATTITSTTTTSHAESQCSVKGDKKDADNDARNDNGNTCGGEERNDSSNSKSLEVETTATATPVPTWRNDKRLPPSLLDPTATATRQKRRSHHSMDMDAMNAALSSSSSLRKVSTSAEVVAVLETQRREAQQQQHRRDQQQKQQEGNGATTSLNFFQYPLDYSIILNTSISSSNSFSWKKKNTSADLATALTNSFIIASNQNLNTETQLDANQNFLSALQYYSFPQLKIEKGTLKPKFPFTERNLQEAYTLWSRSIESIYSLFRNSMCEQFYLIANEFEVVFCKGPKAYISRASKGLKDLLKRNGIQYDELAENVVVESTIDPALQEDLLAIQEGGLTLRVGSRRRSAPQRKDTSLVITNIAHIHILYDVLRSLSFLNSTQRETLQPPLLLSSSPFLNSTCQAASYKLLGRVKTIKEDEEIEDYVMEVNGPLFGPMLPRIAQSLKLKHDQFSLRPLLMRSTIPFNGCAIRDKEKEESGSLTKDDGSALDIAEHFQIVPLSFISSRGTYSLSYENGMFYLQRGAVNQLVLPNFWKLII